MRRPLQSNMKVEAATRSIARHASWALRRVRPGIIGAAGFRRSVTR
jgi:hypothetical protein